VTDHDPPGKKPEPDPDRKPVPLRRGLHQAQPVARWWLKRAGTHVLALITIGGFLFYELMHLYYVWVYSPFQIRPEEIGLTYAQSLSDAIGIVAIIGMCSLFVWAIHSSLNTVAAFLAGLVVALLLIGALLQQVPTLRSKIRRGDPIRKNWLTNPLAVRAVRGRIVWQQKPPPQLKHLHQRKVLFLGSANGFMVVFDPKVQTVIRLSITQAGFVSER
jgi:hypothetical protein